VSVKPSSEMHRAHAGRAARLTDGAVNEACEILRAALRDDSRELRICGVTALSAEASNVGGWHNVVIVGVTINADGCNDILGRAKRRHQLNHPARSIRSRSFTRDIRTRSTFALAPRVSRSA